MCSEMTKRYRLEKMFEYNKSNSLEIWKPTKLSSDSIDGLRPFLTWGYRIFDVIERREIHRGEK